MAQEPTDGILAGLRVLDLADAIGAVGVARAFAYGGKQGQRLWAPIESIDPDGPELPAPAFSGMLIADGYAQFFNFFFLLLKAVINTFYIIPYIIEIALNLLNVLLNFLLA
ncbi:MAG: hypothetical protein K6U74_19810 [Firmicutes bacterium]|nr:hypothetical protein [Bacillota bacterium]